MVPLADPKVEIATESGMIHENIPNILLPKVWKKRGRVMPNAPNVYVCPCFQIHLAPSSHHGDGVANGHLRGRHHCEVGDVDEQVADCDLFGTGLCTYRVDEQDYTPEI